MHISPKNSGFFPPVQPRKGGSVFDKPGRIQYNKEKNKSKMEGLGCW